MSEARRDPAASSIRLLFVGGEPASGIANTRQRLEELWDAKLVEFYGCTEASPAKVAIGIKQWRPEKCAAQFRLPGCKADCGLADMGIEEANELMALADEVSHA